MNQSVQTNVIPFPDSERRARQEAIQSVRDELFQIYKARVQELWEDVKTGYEENRELREDNRQLRREVWSLRDKLCVLLRTGAYHG